MEVKKENILYHFNIAIGIESPFQADFISTIPFENENDKEAALELYHQVEVRKGLYKALMQNIYTKCETTGKVFREVKIIEWTRKIHIQNPN